MRPIHTTLLMGLAAAATSLVAAIYFPWPTFERTSERINQRLFVDLDAKQIRTLEISRVNADKNLLERVLLERRGEKWIFPNHASYTASNAFRIAAVINSLAECTVLELETDKQLDHLKFGVLDMDEPDATRNPGGVGWKVSVRDRNQRVLANLIVGHLVTGAEGRQKRFVRVPGEPQVYVVDFDADALSTRFRDWVDSNLLQLQAGNLPGERLARFRIHSYRIDPESLKNDPTKLNFYEATLTETNNQPAVTAWNVVFDGAWAEAVPNAEVQQTLQRAWSVLPVLMFVDARPKEQTLNQALVKLDDAARVPATYESALQGGFKAVLDDGRPVRFLATGGELELELASGIRVFVYLGNIIPAPTGDARLARIAMLVAEFDESRFPRPAAPTNDDGSPLSEEQQRTHAREIEQWTAQVKQAQQHAANFNQVHAPWYYALDEDIVNLVRPELPQSQ
ncbi:MAG TPA: DUF4340 domain-containing protein [Pirellulaceae bacterium]|nr:DUF4340 domain-containing protein [Pirellulaceae bacterium]